jgi:biotin synthase-like enzyme
VIIGQEMGQKSDRKEQITNFRKLSSAEKLTVAQLMKKSTTPSVARRFISVFTKVHIWSGARITPPPLYIPILGPTLVTSKHFTFAQYAPKVIFKFEITVKPTALEM